MEFTCKEIMPGVRQIGEGNGNYCTLLTGETGALLFDTMTGLGDLRGFVRSLCHTEPVVVCSHGHFDHTGGCRQFDTVYMSVADLPLLKKNLCYIPVLEKTLDRDLTAMPESFNEARYRPVTLGEVYDLGGMTAEVVALPGHTPGGVGLLCREARLLLAGDAVSPQECLLFPESLSLESYDALLERVTGLPFDGFLSAHFDILFPKSCIESFRRCVPLVGVARGMKYAFGPLPHIEGRVYVGELKNEETGQLVCLITKPDTPPLRRAGNGEEHDR